MNRSKFIHGNLPERIFKDKSHYLRPGTIWKHNAYYKLRVENGDLEPSRIEEIKIVGKRIIHGQNGYKENLYITRAPHRYVINERAILKDYDYVSG